MSVAVPAVPVVPPADLRDPSLYLNRELAWLEFNRRVLHEALDPRTPLLERVKFLSIFSSNLDEFFQVRVAGVREQVAARVLEKSPERLAPSQQLTAIRETVRSMVEQHSRCLVDEVMPALANQGIRIHQRYDDLLDAEREHLEQYFQSQVFPVITRSPSIRRIPSRTSPISRSRSPSRSPIMAASAALRE